MATIRISRKDEFLGRFKNFDLYVDGKKVVKIPHGGCSCISLDSGTHILVVSPPIIRTFYIS